MPEKNLNPKLIGFFLGPLLFFLTLLLGEPAADPVWKVLALALWMIIWWITEALPIPVTALLPMVLLPYLGVFSVSEATAPYASPIIFLFMGGFIIALGLEKYHLHQRIALNLIKVTGTSANGIIAGFMIATALLSMWISNTATTVMMLPIAISVIGLLFSEKELQNNACKMFALGLMLSIAYAANIGGSMTLIGTPPNIVMAGYLKEMLDYEISFSTWLMIGIPTGLFLLSMTYFMLTRFLFVCNIKEIEGGKILLAEKLRFLGSLTKEEKLVASIFALTAFGWVFKVQINQLIGRPILSDTTTAMIGGLLMFITPLSLKNGEFVLEWEDAKKLPWGILILFGGGMCLAKSMEKVGLIQVIGDFVAANSAFGTFSLIAIVVVLVLFMTELMSNVALITIFLPVIIGVAQGLNIEPLILVVPATIAASCAFMMPISTPPNAIVFASGHIHIKDMIRAGLLLNVLSIATLILVGYFLVPIILL